jgi:hypothetical protein
MRLSGERQQGEYNDSYYPHKYIANYMRLLCNNTKTMELGPYSLAMTVLMLYHLPWAALEKHDMKAVVGLQLHSLNLIV